MPIVSLNPQRRPLENPADAELVRPAPWPPTKKPDNDASEQPAPEDPLLAFHSEQGQPPTTRRTVPPAPPPAFSSVGVPSRNVGQLPRVIGLALLTLVIATAGIISYSRFRTSGGAGSEAGPSAALEGRTTINSSPQGALVFIDGVARGATPLELLIPVGTHTLQLQNGASMRTLPLDVQAGQSSSHYIELSAPGTARDDISSVPPVTAASAGGASASSPRPPTPRPQDVSRAPRPAPAAPRPAAQTVSSAAPPPTFIPPPPAAAEGWVAIDVPFTAQVSEDGRSIGTTGGGPLRLGAGVHTLELANATYEFRTTLTVAIAGGETTRLPVTLPLGSLSVNALPWAEVFVDGRPIGTTPLANIPVPIGSREILWRHPDFGDRRQLINITARTPVRLGTDFSR